MVARNTQQISSIAFHWKIWLYIACVFRRANLNIIHFSSQSFAMLIDVKTSVLFIRAKKPTLCVFSYLKYKAMTLFLQHTQTTLTFIESGQ